MLESIINSEQSDQVSVIILIPFVLQATNVHWHKVLLPQILNMHLLFSLSLLPLQQFFVNEAQVMCWLHYIGF